jgi:ABC-type amino acid transport substrate-binding protein
VGFDTTGDGADSIVRAVVDHKVDLAVVWGPLAGYFAKRAGGQLRVSAVEPEVDPPGLPFTFAISMGVRKGNLALRDQLDKILADRAPDIRAILDEYGVPQSPLTSLANAAGAK